MQQMFGPTYETRNKRFEMDDDMATILRNATFYGAYHAVTCFQEGVNAGRIVELREGGVEAGKLTTADICQIMLEKGLEHLRTCAICNPTVTIFAAQPAELILSEDGKVAGVAFTEEVSIEELRKRYPERSSAPVYAVAEVYTIIESMGLKLWPRDSTVPMSGLFTSPERYTVIPGHCKDCKWWDKWPNAGELKRPDVAVGGCKLPKEIKRWSIWDGSLFMTAEDFGCIQFQKREG